MVGPLSMASDLESWHLSRERMSIELVTSMTQMTRTSSAWRRSITSRPPTSGCSSACCTAWKVASAGPQLHHLHAMQCGFTPQFPSRERSWQPCFAPRQVSRLRLSLSPYMAMHDYVKDEVGEVCMANWMTHCQACVAGRTITCSSPAAVVSLRCGCCAYAELHVVRCNDLLAVGSGALDMLSCMPSLRRVYLNGLPTMVDVEVRTAHIQAQ